MTSINTILTIIIITVIAIISTFINIDYVVMRMFFVNNR